MSNLITKFLKLDDLAGTLQGVLRKTSDPVLYDEIALRKAEVLAEQSLCKARYDAIDAAQPFSDPGPEAQTALLNAIAAVDRATATTDAAKALLAAAHGLVEAYAAKSTK